MRPKRDFTSNRSNHKWLSDVTYILPRRGWLRLAVILDFYTRQIVGWAMLDRMMTSVLTSDASQRIWAVS